MGRIMVAVSPSGIKLQTRLEFDANNNVKSKKGEERSRARVEQESRHFLGRMPT